MIRVIKLKQLEINYKTQFIINLILKDKFKNNNNNNNNNKKTVFLWGVISRHQLAFVNGVGKS